MTLQDALAFVGQALIDYSHTMSKSQIATFVPYSKEAFATIANAVNASMTEAQADAGTHD